MFPVLIASCSFRLKTRRHGVQAAARDDARIAIADQWRQTIKIERHRRDKERRKS
jgi:hypothetical protein